jgi:formate/nitrite transporter FocA (FNT family)
MAARSKGSTDEEHDEQPGTPRQSRHEEQAVEQAQKEQQKEQQERQEERERKSAPKVTDAKAPKVGTSYSAEEVHGHVMEEAEEEMERPAAELAWSAIAAGMAISFSFLAVAFITPFFEPRAHEAAAGLAYPIGFMFVVTANYQLFTENTLEPVVPVLHRRTRDSFNKLLRLWAIVLPLNLIGALIFALLLAYTPVVKPELHHSLDEVAAAATSGTALTIFYKGIWAGWLVALMAWLLAAAKETTSKLLLIWLTTAPIAALGFKHSIAGATEAFYRAATGGSSWGDVLFRFEIPAIIGNIIGGIVLVALVNHGQAGGGKAK